MQTNDQTDPSSAEEANGTEGLSAAPQDSQKARGSFDLRAGKAAGDGQGKGTMYIMIGGSVVLFIIALTIIWSVVIAKMSAGTAKVDESSAKRDATLDVSADNENVMKQLQEEKARQLAAEEAKRAADEKAAAQTETSPNSAPSPGKPSASGTEAVGQPAIKPSRLRKLTSGLLVTPEVSDASKYVGGVASSDSKADNSPAQSDTSTRLAALLDEQRGGSGGAGGLSGEAAPRSRGSLDNLSGTTPEPLRAFMGPPRKYLLAHNTPTRCVLYTEIVTEQPGLVDCRLTEPLYSADASTVLAEAGAQLTGRQEVAVGPGKVRVFTNWTTLETQWGVRAPLNGLGAGPMGASGTEGWIDRHWKERFGGAVMLSVFQDGLQALTNATQKSSGSGGYTVNNSEQNVENMASKALDSTINIEDTGHVSAGTVITVIVARDIDFSSVYINR
ncbi:TrbI/VirB10 family protein [Pseudomonas fragariae (ex Marin et al. 2024)]|uniref:TrbI/VirB10 family protein n=1 Tax=Pseudomonas fragariae (ex Marin et al. 2024) TaxID=3080056 RepID=UPI003F7B2F16